MKISNVKMGGERSVRLRQLAKVVIQGQQCASCVIDIGGPRLLSSRKAWRKLARADSMSHAPRSIKTTFCSQHIKVNTDPPIQPPVPEKLVAHCISGCEECMAANSLRSVYERWARGDARIRLSHAPYRISPQIRNWGL